MPIARRTGRETERSGWRLRRHLGRQMGLRAGLSISAAVTVGAVVAVELGSSRNSWFSALINPTEHVAFENGGTGFPAPLPAAKRAMREPSHDLMRDLDARFGPPVSRDCHTDPTTMRPRCRFSWRIGSRMSVQAIWDITPDNWAAAKPNGSDDQPLGDHLDLETASGPESGPTRRRSE